MRHVLSFALLCLAPFALGACELTDPFPDDDGGALDGGGGGEGGGRADMGQGGTGGGVMPECSDDDDCPDARPICTDAAAAIERCVECTDSSFCPAERPVCGGDLRCIAADEGACREDFDCPVSMALCLPLSNGPVGVCVECISEDDCPRAAPVCATTGLCIDDDAFPGCSEDGQCGAGRICNAAGTCVER